MLCSCLSACIPFVMLPFQACFCLTQVCTFALPSGFTVASACDCFGSNEWLGAHGLLRKNLSTFWRRADSGTGFLQWNDKRRERGRKGWESPCAACLHPKRVGFPMSGKISLQINPIQTESSVTRSTSFERALPFPTDQNDSLSNLFENRRMGNRTYTYDVHRWAGGHRGSVAVSFLSTQCQKC